MQGLGDCTWVVTVRTRPVRLMTADGFGRAIAEGTDKSRQLEMGLVRGNWGTGVELGTNRGQGHVEKEASSGVEASWLASWWWHHARCRGCGRGMHWCKMWERGKWIWERNLLGYGDGVMEGGKQVGGSGRSG